MTIKEFSRKVGMFNIGEDLEFGLIKRHPGTPEETLETAGCTGGCECYDKDGMPDCERCSQGGNQRGVRDVK